jgi:Tol biopolymer transport system component
VADANVDVWLEDVARATMTRFTFDSSVDAQPIWSPDGQRVVFASSRSGRFDLFIRPADGSADEQPLLTTPIDKAPQDWSPDGQFLLYSVQDLKNASDLWALPLTGDRKPFLVVQSAFDDVHGQFSPDGHWIAYTSNETGRYEIYVRPFPGPGGKSQVSTNGGIYPQWRRDGKELFFISPDNHMMAAPVITSTAFTSGTPLSLFPTQLATGGNVGIGSFASRAEYAVAPDGRFLLNVTAGDAIAAPITIVQNWDAALKK